MNKCDMADDRKVFATLGASNHTEQERQTEDYYATDPKAMELLLEQETFSPNIWECACGGGHLSKILEKHGYNVRSTDLVYRGYGEKDSYNFLESEEIFDGDIITNPPYKYASDFVIKALDSVNTGNKVAMLLKVLFLEGKNRRKLFDSAPPKFVYVFSSRITCVKNGDFSKNSSGALAYAWFVWEKGYSGDTVVKWIN